MPSFVSAEILAELNKQIESSSDHICNNGPDTIEEYRFLAGRIAGLKTAVGVVQDIDRRYEEADDD